MSITSFLGGSRGERRAAPPSADAVRLAEIERELARLKGRVRRIEDLDRDTSGRIAELLFQRSKLRGRPDAA